MGKNTTTEPEILATLRRRLPDLLPALRVELEVPPRQGGADVVLRVRSGRRTVRLLGEIKSIGEPRYLAQAITALTLMARKAPGSYPVVIAPYIAPAGQRLCREAGVGYLDLAGNAYLRFDGILVDRHAVKPPPRARARLRRLFAPRSSRIPRVLLEQPERTWTLAALATEASLSLRTVHLVVNALEEKALVDKQRAALRLTKPGELLDLWAEQYRLDVHRRHTFYTFARDPLEVARRLAAHAAEHQESAALTLHSGATLLAPFVRSPDVHAYVTGDLERLVTALDLRPVESGGTVHLFEPYDAGVFYRVQTLEKLPVVCATQLYLDLLHYPARGREQAEVLRRQVLRY